MKYDMRQSQTVLPSCKLLLQQVEQIPPMYTPMEQYPSGLSRFLNKNFISFFGTTQ